MEDKEKNRHDIDIIDEDLYEDIDEEEMQRLVEEARQEALERAKKNEEEPPKRLFPRWLFWLIAIAMFIHVIALLPQTFSIPAIDFLLTSTRLSQHEDIQLYKEAVVVIETPDSKGTGFAIDENGTILTNHHVIEGEETVTVAFPEDGLHVGKVTAEFPDIDLAVLETDGEGLPYLRLAESAAFSENEKIHFIGNPLRFNGIANEGTIIGSTQLSSWEKPVLMVQAPVYRGNSGSPIITQAGEVIGVVFATLDHDIHGKVGLFVPIDYYYEQIR